jgi:hypothetical protein
MFLAGNVLYVLLAVIIYKGQPWKQPIRKNRPLLIFIIVDLVLIVVISLLTAELSVLEIEPISLFEVAVVTSIMLATSLGLWLM